MSDEFQGKSLVDLLNLLEPVPEPERVSMVPQTAGWVVLSLVLLAGLISWAWKAHRSYLQNAYRRAALRELSQLNDDPAEIASLLRRTALAGYSRQRVACLSGADWTDFLNRSYGGSEFDGVSGQTLLSAPYKPAQPDPNLTRLAELWIKRHRPLQEAL